MNNLTKRKDAIIKIRGHEAIHSVKASGDTLFVQIDSTAAKDFCDATSSALTNCNARLKEYKVFGIVKGVDKACAAELFVGCDGILYANRIGNST